MSNAIPPYDGQHLIADLHLCAAPLDDAELVERALTAGAQAAGASIIGSHFHHFGPGQGVTGVLILAESHMSIHSWPEHCYAAIDIFMCGGSHDIDAALEVIAEYLLPVRIEEARVPRGFAAMSHEQA